MRAKSVYVSTAMFAFAEATEGVDPAALAAAEAMDRTAAEAMEKASDAEISPDVIVHGMIDPCRLFCFMRLAEYGDCSEVYADGRLCMNIEYINRELSIRSALTDVSVRTSCKDECERTSGCSASPCTAAGNCKDLYWVESDREGPLCLRSNSQSCDTRLPVLCDPETEGKDPWAEEFEIPTTASPTQSGATAALSATGKDFNGTVDSSVTSPKPGNTTDPKAASAPVANVNSKDGSYSSVRLFTYTLVILVSVVSAPHMVF